MKDIEIIDADHSKVSKAESDSRKCEDKKVRLTENSKNAIDIVYWNARRLDKKRQNTQARINEIKAELTSENVDFVDNALLNIELRELNARVARYNRKVNTSCRRALKVANFMKNNMISRFVCFIKSKVDVRNVDRDSIAEMVDRQFNGFTNENNYQDEINYQNIDEMVKNKFEGEKEMNGMNDGISSERNNAETVDSNVKEEMFTESPIIPSVDVGSFYRMTKDQIVQDDLSVHNSDVSISDNSDSYVNDENDIISSIRMPRNRDIYETDNEYNDYLNNFYTQESVTDGLGGHDLYEKVSETLVNDSTTINDLERLRAALEAERNTKNQLTRELEEKRMEAAIAQKEAEEAEKEKQAKIQLVNDELAAYKEENERLKSATKEVVEETQRKISMRQEAMNYIDSLNQMIGPQAVNVRTSDASKGRK